ncbi:MAG: hypothetical protein PHU75_00700 [Candidatus Nanopelagicales bacterium]|nr:hypothetical protein [Candidatus Nanopelagicales bacterium]
MAYLRARRGPRGHAQLIGGEVSLLTPDDHAAVLHVMHDHGREPMSMTHGDFDYDYLQRLAVGPDGRRRFTRLSFAAHFDSLMRSRRTMPRPRTEADLHGPRRAFVQMFARLRREHGVRSFLAHNMTVTPANLAEVAEVAHAASMMGFSMLSFQPAAFVGDDRRWDGSYREITNDDLWTQIETGIGTRVPYAGLQFGDQRCNRTSFGFMIGSTWHPLIDDTSPHDLAARDTFLTNLGGITLGGVPKWVAALRLARGVAAHPHVVPVGLRYARGLVQRAGGLGALRHGRVWPMTFVLHAFMDAADVAPAWAMLQDDQVSEDPHIRATQERLQACVYTMAHPETGMLVPACAQHAVLDADENAQLRTLLPIIPVVADQCTCSTAGVPTLDGAGHGSSSNTCR